MKLFTTIVHRLHLWAGVILGVQVLLWMLSGVVMSFYHLDLVRGQNNAPSDVPIELNAEAYASPGGVIAQTDGAYSVELRYFLGRPAYEVRGVAGSALFDAREGTPLSPIEENVARRLARNGFVGTGEIETLTLLTSDPGIEYRGAGVLPVWRAQFDDALNTRLYISPETGEILRRRNDIWRLYDFFWMLHIMDYSSRTDFNNPLIKVASAGGLVFTISGFVMLFFRQSRRFLYRDVARLFGKRFNTQA